MWKLVILGTALLATTNADQLCTTTSVNVRDAPCGNLLYTAPPGTCYPDMGGRVWCTQDIYREFSEVNDPSPQYGHVWLASQYLNADCTYKECSGVQVVTRAQWGARPPNGRSTFTTPAVYEFVHHTVTSQCSTESACASTMRSMQNYHMDSLGWSDIGYSFCAGGDGQIYEGRGWMVVGAHTAGWNSVGHAISAIGDFTSVMPNQQLLDAIERQFDCGREQGHTNDLTAVMQGHRDKGSTACPGDTFYAQWVSTHDCFSLVDP